MISFSVIKNQMTTGKLKFKCVNEKYLKFVDKFGEDKIKEMKKDDDVVDTTRPLTDNAPKNLSKIPVHNASTAKDPNNVA